MHVSILKEIPDDPDLSAAWNGLVLGMENAEVFFTHQWALAASRAFREISPLLFLMYDSAKLAGVVALATDAKAPGSAFFLSSSTADYCDIISAPGNRRAVILALLEEMQKLGLKRLVLANVLSDSATVQELREAARARQVYVSSRPAYSCGVVELKDDEQRKNLVKAVGSKEKKKRSLKKLRSMGTVEVTHLTAPEPARASLQSIVAAQILRFLASGRVSPLASAERRAFLGQLAELLSQAGWLKISQLEVAGRAIAWNYGFHFGQSWFWYLPAFLIEYEYLSPGTCLLSLLVEEAAEDPGLRWFDLGLGDESYKHRFANHVRQTRHIHVSSGLGRHALGAGRQMVSSGAARFPEFSDKLRHARDLWQRVRADFRDGDVNRAARRTIRKALRSVASDDEVLVFEFPGTQGSNESATQLVPLTREHVVEAAIAYGGDASALQYLMRCARRLAKAGPSGLVIRDAAGRPVHFLWIDNYAGFHMTEIDHLFERSSPGAAMIFDCWTPVADRGRGWYAAAIRGAALKLGKESRAAWIFCGARNTASVRGILRAGFAYRWSLVRRKRLGLSVVTRRETTAAISPTGEGRASGQIP